MIIFVDQSKRIEVKKDLLKSKKSIVEKKSVKNFC